MVEELMIPFLHGSEHAVNPAGWTLSMVGLALAIQGLTLGAAGLVRLWRVRRGDIGEPGSRPADAWAATGLPVEDS